MDRGVFVDRTVAKRTMVAEMLGRYKAEILPQKKDVVQLESRLKLLTLYFGSLAIASLRPSQISNDRDAILRLVGPQTVKRELSRPSRVINVALKDWGIALPTGRFRHRWCGYSGRARCCGRFSLARRDRRCG